MTLLTLILSNVNIYTKKWPFLNERTPDKGKFIKLPDLPNPTGKHPEPTMKDGESLVTLIHREKSDQFKIHISYFLLIIKVCHAVNIRQTIPFKEHEREYLVIV